MNRVLYQLSYAAIYRANSEKTKSALSLYRKMFHLSSKKFNFFGHTVLGGDFVRFGKQILLFGIGGSGYVCLELLWRGRSHGSMFLLGGLCFWILGFMRRVARLSLALRLFLSAVCVTMLELVTGLVVNRDHQVWDYRGLPFHYRGQICLLYSLLWIPVCFLGMAIHGFAERCLTRQR